MAEFIHRLFPLLLADIAVQAPGADAQAGQIVGKPLAHMLRVAEDDDPLAVEPVKQTLV